MRIGSLFSGSGQLDEGVRSVLGGTVAWHAEIDPAACRVLAHRYPGVPNLGDVSAVDWTDVEPVDVLTGGSPCQDLSHAGRRAGMTEGTRSNLWVVMREAIAALRPGLVAWENVRGAYSACADSEMGRCPRCVDPDSTTGHAPLLRALGRVVGDLSSLGYMCEWRGLRAADVGAPHGRFRVFVMARNTDGLAGTPRRALSRRSAAMDEPRTVERVVRPDRAHASADASRDGRDEGWTERARLVGGPDAAERGAASTHAASAERRGAQPDHLRAPAGSAAESRERARTDWGQYGPAIRRWERVLGRVAPAPAEPGVSGAMRLSPAFTEWLMGWPDGWVTDVPGVSRNDALKLCGNGVVALQAAEALRRMLGAGEVAA